MTQAESPAQMSVPSEESGRDNSDIDPLAAAILVDEPLFDAGLGEYVPPESQNFDYYEPGDLRCPLDGAGFIEWRGYDGPCEFARIAPGQTTALAPSLSFDDDGESEEILVRLPATFAISAQHASASFGEHVLEVLGECGQDGLWRTSRPTQAWVWIDLGARLRRVVWLAANSSPSLASASEPAANEGQNLTDTPDARG